MQRGQQVTLSPTRVDVSFYRTSVYDVAEGTGFFVDQSDPEKNYAFLPGVTVNADYPLLSGISSMQPSPDWFTGFYHLDVIDEYDRTYWNRMIIHTYPFDAGTDKGTTYTSIDEDQDPPGNVARIYSDNAPFVSPDGSDVYPVAEWDCQLHICPGEGVDCEWDKWPPANGCDLLKYPGCETPCDPQVEHCQQCKPKPKDATQGLVYYRNCCQSNYEPLQGSCAAETSPPSTLSDILPFCDLPPNGFGDPQSLLGTIRACFENYPSCFDLTEQGGALFRCFHDAQSDPSSNIADCFTRIVECVENLPAPPTDDPFNDLPSCAIESGLVLTQCFLDNVGTCFSSCLSMDWSLSLQSLLTDASLLASCPGITANFINPLCQAFSCCEPCVEPWEELSSCLMDDVLGLACDSGCSAEDDSLTRKLNSQDEDMTALVPQAGDDSSNDKVESHDEGMVALSPQSRELKRDLPCNICGCEDCTFADPLGVVNFIYNNKPEKRPCQMLQQDVQNPTIYNTTYCRDVIWRAAFEPCLCYNENFPDVLLLEIPGKSILFDKYMQPVPHNATSYVSSCFFLPISQAMAIDLMVTQALWNGMEKMMEAKLRVMEMTVMMVMIMKTISDQETATFVVVKIVPLLIPLVLSISFTITNQKSAPVRCCSKTCRILPSTIQHIAVMSFGGQPLNPVCATMKISLMFCFWRFLVSELEN